MRKATLAVHTCFFQDLEKENQILMKAILKGENAVYIANVNYECFLLHCMHKRSSFPMNKFSVMKNKSNHACKLKNIPNFKIKCLDAEMGKKKQVI